MSILVPKLSLVFLSIIIFWGDPDLASAMGPCYLKHKECKEENKVCVAGECQCPDGFSELRDSKDPLAICVTATKGVCTSKGRCYRRAYGYDFDTSTLYRSVENDRPTWMLLLSEMVKIAEVTIILPSDDTCEEFHDVEVRIGPYKKFYTLNPVCGIYKGKLPSENCQSAKVTIECPYSMQGQLISLRIIQSCDHCTGNDDVPCCINQRNTRSNILTFSEVIYFSSSLNHFITTYSCRSFSKLFPELFILNRDDPYTVEFSISIQLVSEASAGALYFFPFVDDHTKKCVRVQVQKKSLTIGSHLGTDKWAQVVNRCSLQLDGSDSFWVKLTFQFFDTTMIIRVNHKKYSGICVRYKLPSREYYPRYVGFCTNIDYPLDFRIIPEKAGCGYWETMSRSKDPEVFHELALPVPFVLKGSVAFDKGKSILELSDESDMEEKYWIVMDRHGGTFLAVIEPLETMSRCTQEKNAASFPGYQQLHVKNSILSRYMDFLIVYDERSLLIVVNKHLVRCSIFTRFSVTQYRIITRGHWNLGNYIFKPCQKNAYYLEKTRKCILGGKPTETVNWDDGQALCSDKMTGGILAEVTSEEYMDVLHVFLNNTETYHWVGCLKNMTQGKWLWIHSNEVFFVQGEATHGLGFSYLPDAIRHGYNCLSVRYLEGSLTWLDCVCKDSLLNVLCEAPPHLPMCPKLQNDKIRWLASSTHQCLGITWVMDVFDVVMEICDSHDSVLLTIRDEIEDAEITKAMVENDIFTVYLAAYKDRDTGEFYWYEDDELVNKYNWTKIVSTNSSDECLVKVIASTSESQWRTTSCDLEAHGICLNTKFEGHRFRLNNLDVPLPTIEFQSLIVKPIKFKFAILHYEDRHINILFKLIGVNNKGDIKETATIAIDKTTFTLTMHSGQKLSSGEHDFFEGLNHTTLLQIGIFIHKKFTDVILLAPDRVSYKRYDHESDMPESAFKTITHLGFKGSFLSSLNCYPTCSKPCDRGNCITKAMDFSLESSCECVKGSNKTVCKSLADPCIVNPCPSNSICIKQDGNRTCICKDINAKGPPDCTPQKPCSVENPCQNGGTCFYNKETSESFCSCHKQFAGRLCEKRNPCEDWQDLCLHGGICVSDPTEEDPFQVRCICNMHYTGSRCQTKKALCTPDPCQDTCRQLNITCVCEQMEMCRVLECDCNDRGSCYYDNRTDQVKCNCQRGYEGPHCEKTVIGLKEYYEILLDLLEVALFVMVFLTIYAIIYYIGLKCRARINSGKNLKTCGSAVSDVNYFENYKAQD